MTEQQRETNLLRQTSLLQKVEALNYHNYQVLINPRHKQSDTIRHFKQLNKFPISRSSLNRWTINEQQLRDECLTLSEKNKGKTKTRKSHNPATDKMIKFFHNSDIMKCLKIYYLQHLMIQPDNLPSDEDLRALFEELAQLSRKQSEVDFMADDSSWPQEFVSFLQPQIDAITKNLAQQEVIHKKSKSLLNEKNRLREILRDYQAHEIYQFNELLFDINNLHDLTDLNNDKMYTKPVDNVNLTGDIRSNKTVTMGVCCNLTGVDFIEPLIVSNLSNKINAFNTSSVKQHYYYSPEGLNTQEIFRNYLTNWNTKLSIENKRIALLVDTYWCHFGFLDEFSNIDFVFINSKFDKTTSYYHRTQLKLPFAFGLERFVKYNLKLSLFKKFYKRHASLEAFDGVDIINNLKTNYNLIIESFKNPKYQFFLQLCVSASKILDDDNEADIFENENPLSQASMSYTQGDLTNTQAKDTGKAINKLSSYINSLVPEEYKSIHFSDIHKVLIFKDEEKKLQSLVKTLTKAIIESNPKEDINQHQLQHNILHEFTVGHNEKKYNQPYSLQGIFKYINLLQRHKESLKLTKDSKADASDFKQDIKIDNFLLNVVQPFLSKFSYDRHSENSTDSNRLDNLIKISSNTTNLFNQFYVSYLDDTTIIKPKLPFANKRQMPLHDEGRKRFKLREIISDNSESDLDSDVPLQKSSILSKDVVHSLSSRYRDAFSDSD